MSSNNDEFEVKTVRIHRLDKSNTTTYNNNVTIKILPDAQRQLLYLRIMAGEEKIYTKEFSKLQWLPESSTNGVATIRSSTEAIVIIYNAKNESLLNFFANLQVYLEHESIQASLDSVSSQSDQDQLGSMIDHLIKSINAGSLNDAERIAQELAKLRVDIQFNLVNENDNQEKKITKSRSNGDITRSLDSVLQLTLRVECHMQRDPIIESINVRSGTTLQSLKQQIEKETGIKCTDQYWFAFDRYPISNEYVFGSSVSVISNKNQRQSLVNPIRSGDTLIMYIAQMSPLY